MVLIATGVPVRLCNATATRPKVPLPTTRPTENSDMSSERVPRYDVPGAARGSGNRRSGEVRDATFVSTARGDGSAVFGRNQTSSTPEGGNETRRGTFSLPIFFFLERSSLRVRSGSLATVEGIPPPRAAEVPACATRQPMRSRAEANAVPALEPSGASNMPSSVGSSRSSRATRRQPTVAGRFDRLPRRSARAGTTVSPQGQ